MEDYIHFLLLETEKRGLFDSVLFLFYFHCKRAAVRSGAMRASITSAVPWPTRMDPELHSEISWRDNFQI